MNRHAYGVSLGLLLVLSVLISACGRQAAGTKSTSGQIRPWSYFETSPKPFWWYDTVQVEALHKVAQKFGEKRTVAILDSGFLKGHEDVDNVDPSGLNLCSPDFKDPNDINGHGTALAGITLGRDKGSGLATGGLAPKANLLTVKVVCGVSNVDRVIRGVEFAALPGKRVDVILLALGPWPSEVINGQNVHQLLGELVPKHPEILFVVASIWDGKTLYSLPNGDTYKFPPWTWQKKNVLLVAGMRLDGDKEVEFSDKSGEIWAPARDVETASIEDAKGVAGKHAPFLMQGTSAAAAIVAGCAAAVKLDSDTAESLKVRLVQNAQTETLPGKKPRLDCFRAVSR